MIRINGLEKLTPEEYEKVNVEFVQFIIDMCRDLEEIKSLGDTVNVSGITNESTTFDLDNGKVLRRIKLGESEVGLKVFITEGRHVSIYDFDKNNKKFVNHFECYNLNDLYMREDASEYSFGYIVVDKKRDYLIKIYISATVFDRNIILDYLNKDDCTITGLADILPKDWTYISFDNNKGEIEEIEYYNGNLVTENRGVKNGEERK